MVRAPHEQVRQQHRACRERQRRRREDNPCQLARPQHPEDEIVHGADDEEKREQYQHDHAEGKDAHLLIGTPGGPTIPTSIAAVLFSVLAHGVDPQVSIGEGRTHHQAWPDTLFREDDKPLKEKVDVLTAKGYTIEQRHEPIGDMHGVFRDKGGYIAISDYRREGGAGAL